jgi:hypothetical protein
MTVSRSFRPSSICSAIDPRQRRRAAASNARQADVAAGEIRPGLAHPSILPIVPAQAGSELCGCHILVMQITCCCQIHFACWRH